jgi:hypothetical protein
MTLDERSAKNPSCIGLINVIETVEFHIADIGRVARVDVKLDHQVFA